MLDCRPCVKIPDRDENHRCRAVARLVEREQVLRGRALDRRDDLFRRVRAIRVTGRVEQPRGRRRRTPARFDPRAAGFRRSAFPFRATTRLPGNAGSVIISTSASKASFRSRERQDNEISAVSGSPPEAENEIVIPLLSSSSAICIFVRRRVPLSSICAVSDASTGLESGEWADPARSVPDRAIVGLKWFSSARSAAPRRHRADEPSVRRNGQPRHARSRRSSGRTTRRSRHRPGSRPAAARATSSRVTAWMFGR